MHTERGKEASAYISLEGEDENIYEKSRKRFKEVIVLTATYT